MQFIRLSAESGPRGEDLVFYPPPESGFKTSKLSFNTDDEESIDDLQIRGNQLIRNRCIMGAAACQAIIEASRAGGRLAGTLICFGEPCPLDDFGDGSNFDEGDEPGPEPGPGPDGGDREPRYPAPSSGQLAARLELVCVAV